LYCTSKRREEEGRGKEKKGRDTEREGREEREGEEEGGVRDMPPPPSFNSWICQCQTH